MTTTDPRPALAAALAARLAPAAAYAEDASPEPPAPAEPDYDGSEYEFHHAGESYVGSQDTPGFRAWLEHDPFGLKQCRSHSLNRHPGPRLSSPPSGEAGVQPRFSRRLQRLSPFSAGSGGIESHGWTPARGLPHAHICLWWFGVV